MDSGLHLLPEQAVKEIEGLIRDSIEYGERMLAGSVDEIGEEIAGQTLRRACIRTIVLLEQFGDRHRTLTAEAKRILESVKAKPLETQVLQGEYYLVWPFEIREVIDAFKSLHFEKANQAVPEIRPLLDVLKSSEYYITNPQIFGNVPRSEAQVHERIEGLLKCLYSDTEHKPRLSKPIKGFEADTGIRALRTLIDYKFITSLEDAKRIIEEIFADIGGYQTDDYDRFIFIIYETSRLVRIDEWTRAVEASKPRSAIQIVVLKGSGATGKVMTRKQKGKLHQ